jgi:hypothetical protein
MLTFNPHKRILVEEALAHPYLEQVYWPTLPRVADPGSGSQLDPDSIGIRGIRIRIQEGKNNPRK